MSKFVVVSFFTLLIAAAVVLFAMLRPRGIAAARGPQAVVHEIELPAQGPTQARRVPQQPPAPILPSWGRRAGTSAEGQPDPKRGQLSPWIKDGPPDMSPEGQARSKKMALDAYEHFVQRAQLTPEQQKRFDGIMHDYNKAFDEIAARIVKDHEPFTAEMQQQWDQDAYRRVKALLTTDQYDVFLHEIGLGFGYVATFLRK